jgi:hypothetical protein
LRAIAIVLIAILIATVCVVIAVAHAEQRTRRTTTGPSSASPVPGATTLALEKWIGANLAHETPIAADSAVSQDLAADGFTALPGLPTGSQDWHTEAYFISTPSIRAQGMDAIAAALAASAPVAIFGQGDDRVEVRKIDPSGPADLTSRMATDKSQRKQAGTSLLRNRHVHADKNAQATLSAGQLDLRAATVLAVLADKGDIQLIGVPQDPAEEAAGLPVRDLTVTAPNASALTTTLYALPVSYRPLHITSVAGGAVHLQWDVAIAPVQSLS